MVASSRDRPSSTLTRRCNFSACALRRASSLCALCRWALRGRFAQARAASAARDTSPPAAGWTSYPTLASTIMPPGEGFQSPAAPNSGHGQILWLLSLIFVGVSSMMGSINYLTTIINLRAPGMTLFRMPMTIWAIFSTMRRM